MTSSFLEEQAKARGMTVSEMMRQRSLKVRPENRGLAKNKEAASKAGIKGNKVRWSKKLGSDANG